jgi:histone-binding protein RBBP4
VHRVVLGTVADESSYNYLLVYRVYLPAGDQEGLYPHTELE